MVYESGMAFELIFVAYLGFLTALVGVGVLGWAFGAMHAFIFEEKEIEYKLTWLLNILYRISYIPCFGWFIFDEYREVVRLRSYKEYREDLSDDGFSTVILTAGKTLLWGFIAALGIELIIYIVGDYAFETTWIIGSISTL